MFKMVPDFFKTTKEIFVEQIFIRFSHLSVFWTPYWILAKTLRDPCTYTNEKL